MASFHGKWLKKIPSFLSLVCFRRLAYGRVSHTGFISSSWNQVSRRWATDCKLLLWEIELNPMLSNY